PVFFCLVLLGFFNPSIYRNKSFTLNCSNCLAWLNESFAILHIKRCGQKRGWTMYWAFILSVDFLICCLSPLILRKSKVRAMSETNCPIPSSSLYFRVLVYSKPYYQPLHDNSFLFVTNFFTVYI